MHTRRATPDDWAPVCAVLAEGDAYHREHAPGRYRQPDGPARERESYDGILADPRQALFVAEADGEVLGAVLVQLRETPDVPILVPRRFAVVEDLAVKGACRLRGIARSLMECAHTWARQQGAQQIELNVLAFNAPARSLYERLGYETLSQRMCRTL